MFLLVSGGHVGAHLGGHQHGVSIQISINLEKTFLRISSLRKIAVTWILARVFAYLPSFYFQILDLICWTILIFYFDLFWMAWHWKPPILGIRSRRMFWGWLLRDFRLLPRILFCFCTSESFVLSVVASLECYNCQSQRSPYDCSKNGELVTCAGDESCVRYEINLVGNRTLILSHDGCLKSSLCSAHSKGEIEFCINLKKAGIAGECKGRCCNEDRCNSVSVLHISVLVLLLGILIAAVSN